MLMDPHTVGLDIEGYAVIPCTRPNLCLAAALLFPSPDQSWRYCVGLVIVPFGRVFPQLPLLSPGEWLIIHQTLYISFSPGSCCSASCSDSSPVALVNNRAVYVYEAAAAGFSCTLSFGGETFSSSAPSKKMAKQLSASAYLLLHPTPDPTPLLRTACMELVLREMENAFYPSPGPLESYSVLDVLGSLGRHPRGCRTVDLCDVNCTLYSVGTIQVASSAPCPGCTPASPCLCSSQLVDPAGPMMSPVSPNHTESPTDPALPTSPSPFPVLEVVERLINFLGSIIGTIALFYLGYQTRQARLATLRLAHLQRDLELSVAANVTIDSAEHERPGSNPFSLDLVHETFNA